MNTFLRGMIYLTALLFGIFCGNALFAEDVIEYRNANMEIWVNGIKVHSYYNNKVYTRPQGIGTAGILFDAAQRHRAALSYERIKSRIPGLEARLNGLPLTVDTEITDDDGVTKILALPNPKREGYKLGHVMLEGLPLEIEEQQYDAEGNPTETLMVPNPKREKVNASLNNHNLIEKRLKTKGSVMSIVAKRKRI